MPCCWQVLVSSPANYYAAVKRFGFPSWTERCAMCSASNSWSNLAISPTKTFS